MKRARLDVPGASVAHVIGDGDKCEHAKLLFTCSAMAFETREPGIVGDRYMCSTLSSLEEAQCARNVLLDTTQWRTPIARADGLFHDQRCAERVALISRQIERARLLEKMETLAGIQGWKYDDHETGERCIRCLWSCKRTFSRRIPIGRNHIFQYTGGICVACARLYVYKQRGLYELEERYMFGCLPVGWALDCSFDSICPDLTPHDTYNCKWHHLDCFADRFCLSKPFLTQQRFRFNFSKPDVERAKHDRCAACVEADDAGEVSARWDVAGRVLSEDVSLLCDVITAIREYVIPEGLDTLTRRLLHD